MVTKQMEDVYEAESKRVEADNKRLKRFNASEIVRSNKEDAIELFWQIMNDVKKSIERDYSAYKQLDSTEYPLLANNREVVKKEAEQFGFEVSIANDQREGSYISIKVKGT